MIIYHAALCGEDFVLWGETPEDRAAAATRRGFEQADIPDILPFPYDPGAKALNAFVDELSVSKSARKRRSSSLVRYTWLPSAETGPIPSSPLIAETNADGEIIHIPWAVSVRVLDDHEIVDVLTACYGRQLLAPGRIAGADLAWWCQALRFAGTLVARQRYLPDLNVSENGARSCWMPRRPWEDECTG